MAERSRLSEAKNYQRLKQGLSLGGLLWTPALLAALVMTPLSRLMASAAESLVTGPYAVLAVYFLLLSLFFLFFDFPFAYLSGYVLEKRFHLTNQTPGAWLVFFAKRAVLSFLFSLGLLTALYTLIWRAPDTWRLWAWAGYAFVSYAAGKLFPVWIVPLFYKYDRVADESLKQRILKLTSRFGLPVDQLYTLNLSKTTRKANAAFMGMGRTRRVVLSDTLLENFSAQEIEVVVAHELGHYKNRDILKQLAVGLAASFAAFAWAGFVFEETARSGGYLGPGDPAAMPLLFLIFYVFGLLLTPLQSAFSRRLERAADRFALEAVRCTESFVSCMEKLARQNLSDPDPHPLYEWFFYDHPAIARRIQFARAWEASRSGA